MPRLLLGRYQLVDRLGEGAMGTVYRAHDERLARDVAIKLLRPDAVADDASRRRMRHEARALSRLNHPNIASIFDFETDEATDFIVMELVAGETMSDTIRRGPLAEHEIVRLGAQLADGLEAAHRAGVVHRDLKPGNLRVTPEGRLKILDFGIAREFGAAVADVETMTATRVGFVAGTPAYMSPEQMRGEVVDARTDIYAAGAVLYEMATGRPPHAGTSAPLLIDAVLHQPPVAPRALNARVSPGLEAVVLKALDKDPEQRYQSAKELAVDLSRVRRDQMAATVATAPRRRARWTLRRAGRRWALALWKNGDGTATLTKAARDLRARLH